MSSHDRKIIHVDMDAFYASVEQRDYPEYRGKPLAVGSPPSNRGVISAASYEARRFGVRSAISSYKALQLCPQLILVPGRFDAYKAVSRQIHEIFRRYTDHIEPLSLDEAYLDVTHNKPGIASATQIAQEIRWQIRQELNLTASAGVSFNKFLAKVASDYHKPDGLCVIRPTQAEAFIEALPIERFYGIGKKTAPRLKAQGIHTGGDLKALEMSALRQLLGSSAEFYYQLARGEDHRPVETHWVRKSIGAEHTFRHDTLDIDLLLSELDTLAVEVLDWLNRNQMAGRTLTIKVKYADFQQITRSRTVPHPIENLGDFRPLAQELLQNTEAGARPVRLVGLSISKLSARSPSESDASRSAHAARARLEDAVESQQLCLPLQPIPV